MVALTIATTAHEMPAAGVDEVCYGCCALRVCTAVCGPDDAAKRHCAACLAECVERAKASGCRERECPKPVNPSRETARDAAEILASGGAVLTNP